MDLRHLISRPCSAKGLLAVIAFLLLLPIFARENRADAPEGAREAAQSAQAPTVTIPSSPKSAPSATTMLPAAKGPNKTASLPGKPKFLAGEDPEFAKKFGWPVKYPQPLAGSILPDKRIIAYYGNPLSKRMGVLGQYPKEEMLSRLKKEAAGWEKADPLRKVQPALHLIAVVAQGDPGPAKKYRMVMPDKVINEVYGWAREAGAILFIDIQTGLDDIRTLIPRFEWILKNPDVHLAIDPEFNLIKSGKTPGTKIGTYDAADINFATDYLKSIVRKYRLSPKVLVVHRFTRDMVTNANQIAICPEVTVVMNMDGWGAPYLKRDTYKDYIIKEPVQFTGFKLFYHNDTKKGHALLKPQDLLRLNPTPLYIQYQ